jgi:hypothetical protein
MSRPTDQNRFPSHTSGREMAFLRTVTPQWPAKAPKRLQDASEPQEQGRRNRSENGYTRSQHIKFNGLKEL